MVRQNTSRRSHIAVVAAGDDTGESNSGAVYVLFLKPASLTGDYNANGSVDAADYVMWRKTQGTTVTPSTGADGNGDGVVDPDDYVEWREHFGQTSPPAAAGIEQSADAQMNSPSLQVSNATLAVEVRGVSENQRATLARESAFIEPAAPLARSRAEFRRTLRTLSTALTSLEDSRRNSALLSWLSQAHSEPAIGTWPKGKMVEFDQADNAGYSVLETVDEVFAQIVSDWTVERVINSTSRYTRQ
jgi:Dockerin type I domain